MKELPFYLTRGIIFPYSFKPVKPIYALHMRMYLPNPSATGSIQHKIILHHHHHHLVVPSAQISLTFSRHPSLSFIASGKSSGLHPVSSQSYCMLVRASRPAFARPCEGFYRSTSLMSSSRLLQQYPACLVRLIWIVFVMGGRWPFSCCFVGYCLYDLFNIARSILV